jgi:hypothetical protein
LIVAIYYPSQQSISQGIGWFCSRKIQQTVHAEKY